MKLVQLLAKELKEWPEGVSCMVQDGSGKICTCRNGFPDPHDGDWTICGPKSMDTAVDWVDIGSGKHEIASDQKSSIITLEKWQAEREKMNKPKWIRHRGMKQPVNDGVTIEVKLRSGSVQTSKSENFMWSYGFCDSSANIMQYRVIEETKDQEIEEVIPKHMAFGYAIKEEMVAQIGEECPFAQVASTAEKTNFGTITYKLEIDATEATQQIDSLVAKWGQIESPLKWRDEIIELEAYEEEFRREREKLIRKLESEGFKLIDHMAPVYGEQIIDMSDWRNWQAGDIVRVVISNDASLPIGNEYVVKEIESSEYEDGMPVAVFMIGDSGDYIWPEDIEYQGRQVFEFIRRP